MTNLWNEAMMLDCNNLKSIEGYRKGYMCLNGPRGKVELELDAETCQVVFLALSARHSSH